jgi:predicted nucleic acid-binding protein
VSEVITVRVDRETKRKIKKHGINVSQTVRRALQREIAKKEEENLQRALNEAGHILRKIPEKEIVRVIRDSRDERWLLKAGLLLDANSLLLLIRSNEEARAVKFPIIEDSKILDLTVYELGNGIRKESELIRSLSPDEAEKLASDVSLVLSNLDKLAISAAEFPAVLSIAKSERKTFYDSSYIYVAKREKMTFVTEDQNLSKIARKYVNTVSISEVITKRKSWFVPL